MKHSRWESSVVCVCMCACLCFTIFFTLASQVTLVKNLLASAGDARDVGLIPRLGKSPTGGNGYPLQYSCLENPMGRVVAQTVKRLSTMWETRVRSLGRENPLEKEMAPHSSTLGKSHGRRSLVGCSPWGHKESNMTERLHLHLLTHLEEPHRLPSMGLQRNRHDWACTHILSC